MIFAHCVLHAELLTSIGVSAGALACAAGVRKLRRSESA
jgi:hypothetical protein